MEESEGQSLRDRLLLTGFHTTKGQRSLRHYLSSLFRKGSFRKPIKSIPDRRRRLLKNPFRCKGPPSHKSRPVSLLRNAADASLFRFSYTAPENPFRSLTNEWTISSHPKILIRLWKKFSHLFHSRRLLLQHAAPSALRHRASLQREPLPAGPRLGRRRGTTAAAAAAAATATATTTEAAAALHPLPQDILHYQRARFASVSDERRQNQETIISLQRVPCNQTAVIRFCSPNLMLFNVSECEHIVIDDSIPCVLYNRWCWMLMVFKMRLY